MPSPPSSNRSYFRFLHGEKPLEADLNAGLVDKLDVDVQAAIDSASQNESDLANLKDRVDQHADGAGDLIQTPPEFVSFVGAPTFISSTQFSVTGNFTNEFTVNRAIRAVITGSQPVSQVKTVGYDGVGDKTTVTLFSAILDNTLSEVKLGFIKDGLPRIFPADGTPTTQKFGDVPSAGSSGYVADKDHLHGMPQPVIHRATSEIVVTSTSNVVIMSVTIPANTLVANGDLVRGQGIGRLVSIAGSGTTEESLRLTFGGFATPLIVLLRDASGALPLNPSVDGTQTDWSAVVVDYSFVRVSPTQARLFYRYSGPYLNADNRRGGLLFQGVTNENFAAPITKTISARWTDTGGDFRLSVATHVLEK